MTETADHRSQGDAYGQLWTTTDADQRAAASDASSATGLLTASADGATDRG